MVEAAVADVDGLEASRIEIDAGGPSYTADTLATLLAEDPTRRAVRDPRHRRGRGPAHVGALRGGARPGDDRRGRPSGRVARAHARRVGGGRWVEVPSIEVSSTDLRARAVDGRPLDYLVTHEVADWIEAHGLYRGDAVTDARRRTPDARRRRHFAPGPRVRRAAGWPCSPLAAGRRCCRRPALTYVGIQTVRDEPGRQERVDRDRSRPARLRGASSSRRPRCCVLHASGEHAACRRRCWRLSSGDAGGSVLLVPPATRLERRARRAARSAPCPPSAGRRRPSIRRLQDVLGVGLAEVVVVDDARWAELVAPGRAADARQPRRRRRVPGRAALPQPPSRSVRTSPPATTGRATWRASFRQQLLLRGVGRRRGRVRRPGGGARRAGLGHRALRARPGARARARWPRCRSTRRPCGEGTRIDVDPEAVDDRSCRRWCRSRPRRTRRPGRGSGCSTAPVTREHVHHRRAARSCRPASEIVVVGNADRFDYEATEIRYHDPVLQGGRRARSRRPSARAASSMTLARPTRSMSPSCSAPTCRSDPPG